MDRVDGKLGVCRQTATCRIASTGPHYGEEPSFTGTRGSGTIFFSGCSCRCFFCQNYQISIGGMGRDITPDELVQAAQSLALSGVHNLNFVTPDHFWPHIRRLCRELKKDGVSIPTIFNSSGYQRADLIEEYAECIDIFMPDFSSPVRTCPRMHGRRTVSGHCAEGVAEDGGTERFFRSVGYDRRSARATWCSGAAFNSAGSCRKQSRSSAAVARGVRKAFAAVRHESVSSRARMCRAETARSRITREEHKKVIGLVYELGFQRVYLQKIPDTADFLPDFAQKEPFEGNKKRRMQ